MKYKDLIKVLQKEEDFKKTLEFILSLKGKRVLYFSHDDPDGITSGYIFSEIFKHLSIDYEIHFPPNFALRESDIKGKKYDAIVITDKGTLAEYDKFSAKPFLTIDHHYSPAVPKKVLWYNPSITKPVYCSASFLAHNFATALGIRDDYLDLIAMTGLKGDWAIDPSIDLCTDYVRPLYEEFKNKFPHLIKKRTGLRPTMFDASQKKYTTILSRFTHCVHALCGGGFQYFYNDKDKSLLNIDQPYFTYEMLSGIKKSGISLKKVKDEKDLMNIKGFSKKADLILELFEKDWDHGVYLLNTSVELISVAKTRVFIYCGIEMNLMPMLGSVVLYDLAKGEDAIFIMVAKKPLSVHFCVRATGGNIHSGKLCQELSSIFKKTVSEKKRHFIAGGGHPKAAECNINIPKYHYDDALRIFLKEYEKMKKRFCKKRFGV